MVKPTVRQLRCDSNRVVHLVRADEAKPALVEALKLNANLNLLARMRSSDAVLAANVRQSMGTPGRANREGRRTAHCGNSSN
jgi:hypothetical protein